MVMEQYKSMSFGLAIEAAKKGHSIARVGWNGKGIFVEIQVPDEHSKMSHSYLYIDTTGLVSDNPDAPKSRVPWLASQTDMLSDDWVIVKQITKALAGGATSLKVGRLKPVNTKCPQ